MPIGDKLRVFHEGELTPEEVMCHSCWDVIDGHRIQISEPQRYGGVEIFDKDDKKNREPIVVNFRPL